MAKKPRLDDLDPTAVSEVFTRRVAVMAIGGASSKKIADEMGLTVPAIEAIQSREDYKSYLKNVGEQDLNVEVMRMKHRLAIMADKAAKVYEKVMDDYLSGKTGAKDAVTVAQSVSRSIGADKGEVAQSDTTLTVILPGGKDIITVKADVE